MRFLQEADEFPPVLCRVMARDFSQKDGLRPLKISEISKLSGIPLGRCKWIAKQPTWKSIAVDEVDAFMEACGLFRDKLNIARRFLRTEFRKPVPLAHIDRLSKNEVLNIRKAMKEIK